MWRSLEKFESFDGKLGDALLSQEVFTTLLEAKIRWRAGGRSTLTLQ